MGPNSRVTKHDPAHSTPPRPGQVYRGNRAPSTDTEGGGGVLFDGETLLRLLRRTSIDLIILMS